MSSKTDRAKRKANLYNRQKEEATKRNDKEGGGKEFIKSDVNLEWYKPEKGNNKINIIRILHQASQTGC